MPRTNRKPPKQPVRAIDRSAKRVEGKAKRRHIRPDTDDPNGMLGGPFIPGPFQPDTLEEDEPGPGDEEE